MMTMGVIFLIALVIFFSLIAAKLNDDVVAGVDSYSSKINEKLSEGRRSCIEFCGNRTYFYSNSIGRFSPATCECGGSR